MAVICSAAVFLPRMLFIGDVFVIGGEVALGPELVTPITAGFVRDKERADRTLDAVPGTLSTSSHLDQSTSCSIIRRFLLSLADTGIYSRISSTANRLAHRPKLHSTNPIERLNGE